MHTFEQGQPQQNRERLCLMEQQGKPCNWSRGEFIEKLDSDNTINTNQNISKVVSSTFSSPSELTCVRRQLKSFWSMRHMPKANPLLWEGANFCSSDMRPLISSPPPRPILSPLPFQFREWGRGGGSVDKSWRAELGTPANLCLRRLAELASWMSQSCRLSSKQKKEKVKDGEVLGLKVSKSQ